MCSGFMLLSVMEQHKHAANSDRNSDLYHASYASYRPSGDVARDTVDQGIAPPLHCPPGVSGDFHHQQRAGLSTPDER